MINLLSTDPLRNLLETLRIGKAIELLWRESTSTEFDEDLRMEMFNKCINKRLDLMYEESKSERLVEEKIISSKRTPHHPQNHLHSGRPPARYVEQEETSNRYGSGRDEEGRFNRYGSENDGQENNWNLGEFGDFDQLEKMMIMKSFKKKKLPQKSMNTRYSENFEDDQENGTENGKKFSEYKKGFDPKEREKRQKHSMALIKVVARLVLNMIKHQSKRDEIGRNTLKKHKEMGYQMLRKFMKSFEQEVNKEEEVEMFVERFCPEEVIIVLEEFRQGNIWEMHQINKRKRRSTRADPIGH